MRSVNRQHKVKNDTLYLYNLEYGNDLRICWKDIEWMRFQRSLVGSVVYDYIMFNGTLYASGIAFLTVFFSINSEVNPVGLIAVYLLSAIAITTEIHLIKFRFRKCQPEKYMLKEISLKK